jgi:hypothetical protein
MGLIMNRKKWADEIHAWANGAEIEYRAIPGVGEWKSEPQHLIWEDLAEYRIKEQTKKRTLYIYNFEDKSWLIDQPPDRAIYPKNVNYMGKIEVEL